MEGEWFGVGKLRGAFRLRGPAKTAAFQRANLAIKTIRTATASDKNGFFKLDSARPEF